MFEDVCGPYEAPEFVVHEIVDGATSTVIPLNPMTDKVSLAVDGGRVVIGLSDALQGGKGTVFELQGTALVPLGMEGFTNEPADVSGVRFVDGVLYAALSSSTLNTEFQIVRPD